jgi:tripartite-type tricarboxylate transporter receptor subunit TctC
VDQSNAGNNAESGQTGEAKPAIDFPKKTIELIVPYAAGGSTDVVARALAEAVNRKLTQGNVVVVNKPGGSGTIGLAEVANAKADGYKIGLTTTTATSVQPHYPDVPIQHDSFQAILRYSLVPYVLVVNKDAPWQTFDEWMDYVKNNPDQFTYGVAGGKGGLAHIAMEAVSLETGIKVKSVPFDGAAPLITALMGGHIHGGVIQGSDAKAQVEEGNLRVLAIMGSKKMEIYGDAPLLTEKGINVQYDVYAGMLAPKGLPEEIVNALYDMFKGALEDPEVLAQFKQMGIQPDVIGPDEFQQEITNTYLAAGEVMKQIGLLGQ